MHVTRRRVFRKLLRDSGEAIEGPIYEDRASDDEVLFNEAPVSAIEAFIAIIADHEVIIMLEGMCKDLIFFEVMVELRG